MPLLLQKAGYRTGIIGKYLNQVRFITLVSVRLQVVELVEAVKSPAGGGRPP